MAEGAVASGAMSGGARRFAAATLLVLSVTAACSSEGDAGASGGLVPSDSVGADDDAGGGSSSSPASDDPQYEDEQFTMRAAVPGEGGCSNTTAQLGESGPNVEEDNQLGALDSVDIQLRTCPTETFVRFDAGPIAEVDGERDLDGCLDALTDPAGVGKIPPDELPGRSFCLGHRYTTDVSFLTVVDADAASTTVTWSVTRWSNLDIPSW